MRPERAADHSLPSSAAVMEEESYTCTHPLGHTGPAKGKLCLLLLSMRCSTYTSPKEFRVLATIFFTFARNFKTTHSSIFLAFTVDEM